MNQPQTPELPVDPGNPFLQDLNTGMKWAPFFSTIRAGDIVVWQMTIRVGPATITVRLDKENAEKFSEMVANSVIVASPIIVPDNPSSLLRQMNGRPPGVHGQ